MVNRTVKKEKIKQESKYLDLTSYFISCIDKKLFYLVSPVLITVFVNIWLDNNMDLNYFLRLTIAYFTLMITLALICYKHKKKHQQRVVRKIHLGEKVKTFGIMLILTLIETIVFGYAQTLIIFS